MFFFGCESLQSVIANGDTRTISLYHVHTGEDLTITYKREGRYDEAALTKINYILRDWRRDEPIKMDPHLIDLVWEVQREAGSKQPIQIVCGYRAPATNSMLRARSRGVAQFSQHMLGKAMDFYMPDVELTKIREIGLHLQRGGVGFYPTSGSPFVHLDTGNVRHWPKVSREYLAKIFPDGKTVHVPIDGRPMPGYQLALAEIRARGEDTPSYAVASADENGAMADSNGVKKFFAKIFGKKDESGDDEESQITTVRARSASEPVVTASVDTTPKNSPRMQWNAGPSVKTAEVAAPLPRPRPAAEIAAIADQPVQVASLNDNAPLPAVITGGVSREGLALGYAADSIFSPREISSAPAPVAAAPAQAPLPTPRRASAPLPATTASISENKSAVVALYADAAHAPASLFDSRLMQDAGEMHQQDPATVMTLAVPTRTALRTQFTIVLEQPALSRFAGPAVVSLPTVYFGQPAMISGTTRVE
jgi:uncharacterized protein YcbK (DUF882 family)